MVTAQQITDLERLVRQLNPGSEENEEYLTLLKSLPGIGGLAALGGQDIDILAADFVVNNSVALVDTGLESSNLVIGESYDVEVTLLVSSVTAVPDLKLKFESSTNSTFSWTRGAPVDASVAVKVIGDTEAAIPILAGTGLMKVFGILTVVDTIGTLKLTAAQNVATVEDTKILIGSSMILTRIK